MPLKINAQQVAADSAVVGSWSGTAFAWLANVNEVLQFGALAIAIISGIYAIRVYRKKLKDER